jgi:two-component system, chemotaxis family, chemotaxis protein CheY
VLVVDDDRDVRELLAELLAQEGYHVIMAASAEEALARLETVIPDLIVSDLMMPGMDGAELLARLGSDARYAAIPTILLTAAGELMAERAVAEARLRTLLVHKPIRIGEFLHLVSWRLNSGPTLAIPSAPMMGESGLVNLD